MSPGTPKISEPMTVFVTYKSEKYLTECLCEYYALNYILITKRTQNLLLWEKKKKQFVSQDSSVYITRGLNLDCSSNHSSMPTSLFLITNLIIYFYKYSKLNIFIYLCKYFSVNFYR